MMEFLQTSTSTKNQKENYMMFLILIKSQIINLKIVGGVLGLRGHYQCGGETLVPVVKHSVSDSNWDTIQ